MIVDDGENHERRAAQCGIEGVPFLTIISKSGFESTDMDWLTNSLAEWPKNRHQLNHIPSIAISHNTQSPFDSRRTLFSKRRLLGVDLDCRITDDFELRSREGPGEDMMRHWRALVVDRSDGAAVCQPLPCHWVEARILSRESQKNSRITMQQRERQHCDKSDKAVRQG